MFYKAFVPSVKRLLNDKTLVEYRTNPNSRVVIHYVCQVDDNETQEYKKTEMKHMFGGIYSKAFVLFFGESLQYYITEEQNGAEQLTQSDTIRKSDMVREEEENKFSLLNDIVLSKTLQDYDTLDKLSEEYERKSYLVKEIFQIE